MDSHSPQCHNSLINRGHIFHVCMRNVFVCVCACACWCALVCMCLYACVRVGECVWVCACACLHVRVCVCVGLFYTSDVFAAA